MILFSPKCCLFQYGIWADHVLKFIPAVGNIGRRLSEMQVIVV